MSDVQAHSLGGIAYLDRPGGAGPLVILHGIGSNAASFAPLMDRFPKGLRVLAWNAPGYGGSDPLPMDRPRAADYAGRLAAWLDALGIARCTLLGHSLGTLIAAAFARAYPARVDRLVLAACAQGYGIGPDAPLPPKAAQRLADLDALGPVAFAQARAANLIHDPAAHPDAVAQVTDAMSRIARPGYDHAVHMLAAGDLAGDLAHVDAPCRFVLGAEDTITPADQTDTAAAAWAARTGQTPDIRVVPQAGHALYVQRPDAFLACLTDLWSDLSDPTQPDPIGIGG